jgi:hypothetical protein
MDEDNLRVFLKGPRWPENPRPDTTDGDGQAADKEEWPQTNVSYRSVRRLGGGDEEGGFRWLWRSAFEDYDQLNVIWQKSLVRMAIAWQAFKEDLKPRPGEEPLAAFAGYDLLDKDESMPESFSPERWLERAPDCSARSYLVEATDPFVASVQVLERLFEQAVSPRPRPASGSLPGLAVDS